MVDLLEPIVGIFKQQKRSIFPSMPYETTTGKIQPGNYRAMIQAYQSWVYACASVNASNVAKARLRLFVKRGDEKEEIKEHVILDLFKNVNPFMNAFELKELTELYLEITGNAYWYLVPTRLRGQNRRFIPGEIWVLESQYIRIVPDPEKFIRGYIYHPIGMLQGVAFDESEIMHFKFPNPANRYYGMGPLEAARYAADSNEFQKKYEIGLFKNMARPDGVLETESNVDEKQMAQLRAQWQQLYEGSDNTGKVAILEKGLKYHQVAINPKELDFLRGRIATREEIMAIFGTPASKLGLVEDVNRSNAEANDFTYQSETIKPRLIRMQEKLNEKLLLIYDEKLFVEFDDPVPENREFRLQQIEKNLSTGYSSINEERAIDGREPVSWGNVPIMPFGVAPLGEELSNQNNLEQLNIHAKAISKIENKSQRRKRRWQLFQAGIMPAEKGFGKAMQRFFKEQRRIVSNNIERLKSYEIKQRDPLVDRILFPLAEEERRLSEIAQQFVEQALTLGATLGAGDLGTGINFDLFNPIVSEALKRRIRFFAERVNETTAQEIIDAINQGLEMGESINQIAQRIEQVYDEAQGARSLRIARTEVISAANSGQILAYEHNGVTHKEWLTAKDEIVRESHSAVDGDVVGIHQKFIVGNAQLDHPGDPSGPPEEIINCRCTIIAARILEGGEEND